MVVEVRLRLPVPVVLPDGDRAVIDTALRAWWAATDAAGEVLP